MARQSRIKFAALATAFVAALGIVAVSPAVGSEAGQTHSNRLVGSGGRAFCC